MTDYVGPKSDSLDLATQGDTSGGSPESWREIGGSGNPTFANSWTNYGGSYSTAAFYKDSAGIVHLKGLIKSGTMSATAFTLPVGYRPAQVPIFPVNTNPGNAMGRVDIGTDGTVAIQQGNNTYISLDGIRFRAA